ncbi:MAG: DUF5050 domain-containing protein, partial [Crenarchaeota archaeon]|nr:DUF5050 domain-containing protein [Thermoproteota archaeon]
MIIKKKPLITFLIILISLGISPSSGRGMSDLDVIADKNVNNKGNTSGNIINRGFIAEQAGWLYLSNFDFKEQCYGIFKMKKDGTLYQRICKDYGEDINVIGDWIYYRNINDCKIYKIRVDGKKRKKICNDPVKTLFASKGWLYYININDRNIYKVQFNGKEKFKLCNDEIWTFIVDDEWIFYINLSDNKKLYKMRIDGSDRTKITDEKPITLIKHFDWIYFQRNAEMYKVNIIDGTIESLGINNVGQINILDKYIIYSGFYSNKGGLYKISTDGRENTKIIQDEKEIKEINIIDG